MKGFTPLEIQNFHGQTYIHMKHPRERQSLAGFTLIELLVYVALLGIVITLTMQFTLGIVESSAKASAKEEVEANSARILQAFDFLTRQAESVYDPTSDFIGNPGQLSLVTSTNLPSDEARSYVDLYADDGKFCAKNEQSGVTCFTSTRTELTSLTFRKITQSATSTESVQMRFQLRYRNPRPDYQASEQVQTAARFRSY